MTERASLLFQIRADENPPLITACCAMTARSSIASHNTQGVGSGEYDQDLLLFRGRRLTVWNGGGILVDSECGTGI